MVFDLCCWGKKTSRFYSQGSVIVWAGKCHKTCPCRKNPCIALWLLWLPFASTSWQHSLIPKKVCCWWGPCLASSKGIQMPAWRSECNKSELATKTWNSLIECIQKGLWLETKAPCLKKRSPFTKLTLLLLWFHTPFWIHSINNKRTTVPTKDQI